MYEMPLSFSVSTVDLDWSVAVSQLNTNLVTIGSFMNRTESRLAALEAKVEKLGSAKGVGDNPTTPG
jgi:hypothetical protein